jgi:hypothetical protein
MSRSIRRPSLIPGDVEIDGLPIRYRLPTGRDLVSIESLDDPVIAGRSLIERCVEVRVTGRKRSSAVVAIDARTSR